MAKQQELPRNGNAPTQPNGPGITPPLTTPCAFTAHELDTLRKVCRDSDNENASRILAAGLARGVGSAK